MRVMVFAFGKTCRNIENGAAQKKADGQMHERHVRFDDAERIGAK